MRRIAHALIGISLLALLCSPLPALSHSAGAAPAQDRITAIRVTISKATRVFDEGTAGVRVANQDYTTVSYDDSLWSGMSPVSDNGANCVSQNRGSIEPALNQTAATGPCSAVSFNDTIRAHSAVGVSPTPNYPTAGSSVAVVYPTKDLSLPRLAPIAFVWKPFSKAANYVLQIWLTKRARGAALSNGADVTFSTLVSGRTSYFWNAATFVPGTYHYDLVPLDSAGNALAKQSRPASFALTR